MTSPPLDNTQGRQCQAWQAITALGWHIQTDDVGRGMKSPPLDSRHCRTTSGVAFHHRLLASHTIERRRAWHHITSLVMHAWSDDVGRGITSPCLDSTLGRQHRAWHDITALGLRTQSDDIRCGMTSPPLDRTHGRQRRAWHDITAIGQHTRSTTLGVACHYRP